MGSRNRTAAEVLSVDKDSPSIPPVHFFGVNDADHVEVAAIVGDMSSVLPALGFGECLAGINVLPGPPSIAPRMGQKIE